VSYLRYSYFEVFKKIKVQKRAGEIILREVFEFFEVFEVFEVFEFFEVLKVLKK